MSSKLFKSIFLASISVFLLCFTLIFVVLYNYFSYQSWDLLEHESDFLASAIEQHGTDFLSDMADYDSSRVTLIDPYGKVLFDNMSTPEGMENHSSREEFISALKNGTGRSQRYSQTLSKKTTYYAVRLSDGNVLRVSGSQYTILTMLTDIIFPLVVIIALAILLSVLFAAAVSRKIIRPITNIDLDEPYSRDVYEELRPFIEKTHAQNRQIQQQMVEMKAAHEKQDSMRREFTANVSHELKTPLTAISGTAEILRDGLVKPEDIPHFAGNIYKESQRLIVLVSDIMKLSQMDEDAISDPMEPIDLGEICRDVISRLSSHAKRRGISLEYLGEDAEILGSKKLLDEMIFNLCDNAIKYNKDNGSVTISAQRDGEHTILTVSDTGIGIPNDSTERVFERFYRVDKSHSKETGGTGLGLAIVKHAARYHNAEIELESRLGVGTRISVIF
ncbi:MAG: two-component sensor histidine kinase [Clostridia bacterium]|nr:two-component sensor histidine kinase [Clostridia bacterium]